MGRVVFDISMSLDGYMTAAEQTPEEPLGPGGQRLTEWAFGTDEQNQPLLMVLDPQRSSYRGSGAPPSK
jgi:hypothetical protein